MQDIVACAIHTWNSVVYHQIEYSYASPGSNPFSRSNRTQQTCNTVLVTLTFSKLGRFGFTVEAVFKR
ncbi:hypothetical protein ScPMuIL_006715 [Solemya velum]